MKPRKFSNYILLDKLGEWGMGEVYLAEDPSLGRRVAVKLIPDAVASDPIARKRFLREARAAASLDHPYIASVHDAGEEGGRPFLVMEYVTGETLAARIAAGPIPIDEALQEAHARGSSTAI